MKDLLQNEGFHANVCTNANDALNALSEKSYDLVLCDVMMPEMDGFELCAKIRTISKVPIMFVTAKVDAVDKVSGLTVGADDYVTKPFENHELVARIKSHIRRYQWDREDADKTQTLTVQNITLNPAHHECSIEGQRIDLSPKEFALLFTLMEDPKTPHSIQELFESIWGQPYDKSGGNSVMVHIRRLRKKLAHADSTRNYIVTVWGVGYKMQL